MKASIRQLSSLMIALILTVPFIFAQEGGTPFDPAPAGVQLSGIIECGRGYTTHELYDMKITLLEVLRGSDAWNRLLQADKDNKPADSGFEYILTRIRFEYNARTAPGLCVHKLLPAQFAVFTIEGANYQVAEVAVPQPPMRGDLKSGDSLEGWIAFAVPVAEQEPMLNYSADAGGAVLHGGGKWFKLY